MLDFETEDPLDINPVFDKKKRKKVIGLDDLVVDHYKEENKRVENDSKRAKVGDQFNSDDEEDTKEVSLSRLVNECQTQMSEIEGEEDVSAWGINVFGAQKSPPPPISLDLTSCHMFQSFMENELNSLVELSTENGDSFFGGLLTSGWLSELVGTCGRLEESVARWTFHLILYSSKEELRSSACNFWCAILSCTKKPLDIEWFPSYSELKKAVEVYGFHFNHLSNMEAVHTHSCIGLPAQNVRVWIKIVTASCQARSKWSLLSTSEAEELVEVIICLFLDRRLVGLAELLFECMQSVIGYFTDEEWNPSCDTIAKSLASRVPRDLNCLRMVECISVFNSRSKHLRSTISYQILHCFFVHEVNEEDTLRSLISINMKDRSCDLFKLFIYLVLAENWLLFSELLKDKPVLNEMWRLLLRNCSCLINSTDLRSFASKVRTKASYLLQGTIKV